MLPKLVCAATALVEGYAAVRRRSKLDARTAATVLIPASRFAADQNNILGPKNPAKSNAEGKVVL